MKSNNSKITQAATAAIGVLAVLAAAVATPAPAQAQDATWNGLIVAAEARCSPYDSGDYRYSQSVEDRIVRSLGSVYGPYTGAGSGRRGRPTSSTSSPGPRLTTAACAGPTGQPGGGSPRTCGT